MTTLLADIGNTNIKWALLEAGAPGTVSTLRHDGPADISDWAAALNGKVDNAVCCNVAGPEVAVALESALGDAAITCVVPSRIAHGLRNAYRDPEQLGADRWVAMIAAWQRCNTAVCVVDAGTAFTVDLVDGTGRHLGGYIVPGRYMMSEMLDSRTRDIRDRQRAASVCMETSKSPGRNTREAVAHGAAAACAGLVSHARAILAQNERAAPRTIVTGGDAEWLANATVEETELAPALVLEGLAVIAGQVADD